MTRKYISNSLTALVLLIFSVAPALANDIYIEQVGDTLDLDIVQDGTNNVIGTSTTDVNLDGDSMTFAITQTGSLNTIVADIQGDTYTGTWVFTGDSNTVDLSCDSTSGTNCENITLNITATGDSNAFTFDIGDTADADGSTIGFTITGDGNVINSNVDGVSALVAVTVNNSSSTASGGATSGLLSASGAGNVVDINISGDGDSAGHTVKIDATGGASSYTVTQSGVNDNMVDADFAGDDQDVDITQSD
tara:strand:+ start:3490 stop:4236 length:747 start_codon:yes stop_codon:yes gene_type:complete